MTTCEICGKSFTKLANLPRHLNSIHGIWKDGYQCVNCGYTFQRKEDIRKHIHSEHLKETQRSHQCGTCKAIFLYKRNLQCHIRTVHNKKAESLKCDICSKSFTRNYNLKRHKNRMHKKCNDGKGNKTNKHGQWMNCGMCNLSFSVRRNYTTHLQKKHNIKMVKCEFTSEKEFNIWKQKQESSKIERYRLCHVSTGEKKIVKLFICNRVGQIRTKIQRRRMPRRKGLCRIGAMCPAHMTVTIINGKYFVENVTTHWFHKKELSHIAMSGEEKNEICGLIVPASNGVNTHCSYVLYQMGSIQSSI